MQDFDHLEIALRSPCHEKMNHNNEVLNELKQQVFLVSLRLL